MLGGASPEEILWISLKVITLVFGIIYLLLALVGYQQVLTVDKQIRTPSKNFLETLNLINVIVAALIFIVLVLILFVF